MLLKPQGICTACALSTRLLGCHKFNTVVQIREKGNAKRLEKRVAATVEKMLLKRPKLERKFYDKKTTSYRYVDSAAFGNVPEAGRAVNPDVVMRERTVSRVLIREIQDVIDSGMASEDLAELGIVITDALMRNRNECVVTWQAEGTDADLHVTDLLNRLSGRIRHVLMHNHVVGRVPILHFRIDPGMAATAEVENILRSSEFDVGASDEDPVAKTVEDDDGVNLSAASCDDGVDASRSKRDATRGDEKWSVSCVMFGIDHDALRRSIERVKSGASANCDRGQLIALKSAEDRRKRKKDFEWDEFMPGDDR